MIVLSGTLEGDKELSRRFNKIPQDIGNNKAIFFRIGREVRISADVNFASRGSTFGEKWQPRKDNKPWPILERTGLMRRSFNQRLGPNYVEISNSAQQFKYHQSNKARNKLPRRVMLKLDEIRRRYIVKQFQVHIKDSMKKS